MKKIFLFILVFSFTYSCCDCPTSGENNSSSTEGVTKEESKPKEIYCPKCGGSGEGPCSICGGDGWDYDETCYNCNGSGVGSLDCRVCDGRRKVPALE